MPLVNSYVIWNNKGGVGKTTLTFHMATHIRKTLSRSESFSSGSLSTGKRVDVFAGPSRQ